MRPGQPLARRGASADHTCHVVERIARFVSAFKRGIDGEVRAMRDSSAAFEIPLTGGEDLGALRYSFALARTDRVAPGTMAALRSPRDEQRVAIERVADDRI